MSRLVAIALAALTLAGVLLISAALAHALAFLVVAVL